MTENQKPQNLQNNVNSLMQVYSENYFSVD